TGTPLFAENARDEFGDLARTTEEQYGQGLHQYTVKEAIHDKAVLGFQVEYKETIDELQIEEYLLSRDPNLNINNLNRAQKESKLDPSVFDTRDHMEQVVDSIINKSQKKLGLPNDTGQAYSAILTTSSI